MVLFLFLSAGIGTKATAAERLKISSPAFGNNAYIPSRHSCEGTDSNPPLLIEHVPAKTKSLALIVDDYDAPGGIWVHWVVWNIPSETKEIKESSVPAGAIQGLNDFRKNRYNGPCPPPGTHRYFFKIYAIDTVLRLTPNSTKTDLEKAIKGHIIEQAEIIGLYKRK